MIVRSICRIVPLAGFLVLLLAFYSQPARGERVVVFAAASLHDVMDELTASFAVQHSGAEFIRNHAASGTLARQIAAGAPADIYLSANPRWLDFLMEKDRIAEGRVATLARNDLVFIGREALEIVQLEDLLQLERIALGSPSSVPAGEYAVHALEAAGLYGILEQQSRLVMARDVRQALIYADRGEVDGAFVYRTDGRMAKRAVIHFAVPGALYPEVFYPMALTTRGAKNKAADEFFHFLQGEKAQRILERHGFLVSGDL